MRRAAALAVFLAAATAAGAAPRKRSAPRRPRLVVMVAVDQLRADLLDRYDALFTGGFRRLRERGLRFDRAVVDHALTDSLPGHATLATGAFPSRHGIVDSAWAEIVGGKPTGVFGVSDDAAKIVGFPKLPGASPQRILVPGIGEWFEAKDPGSRVVAIGSGEYSSLLHAVHAKSLTYWFSPDAERYVTSSYYAKEDPEWVRKFEDREIPKLFAQRVWSSTVPPSARNAPADAEPSEFDHVHTTFPHRFEDERPKDAADERRAMADWLYFTPMLDRATLDLVEEALGRMRLGRNGHTDYLSVVFSAVDSIGHRWGPLSLEQLDTLLRLDAELGELFGALDRAVGRDGWVLGLSADHGCRDIPEAKREDLPGRRVARTELDEMMKAVFDATSGRPTVSPETARVVAEVARRADFVADAVPVSDLLANPAADPIRTLFSHSVRADRVPITLGSSRGSLARFGVVAWMKEGDIDDEAPANHGSPYEYDRRVPLIFLGSGIPAGHSDAPARTVDLAPTLASLAGVPVPNAVDGVVLRLAPR